MIVYLATNLRTGLKYVGVTVMDLEKRKARHRSAGRPNKKGSYSRFQSALLEQGWETFAWAVLSICSSPEEMFAEEQRWIAELKTMDVAFGYNMTPGGGSTSPITEETRRKISAAAKARRRGPHSDETRKRMSEAGKGKPRSEEYRRNISIAKMGKPIGSPSKEHRRKLSIALTGLTKSDEHRRKLSEATRANWLAKKAQATEART